MLISGLFHLGLFMLLQVLLGQSGSPASPTSLSSSGLAVRILQPSPVAPLPEPARASGAAPAKAPPATAGTDRGFGLETLPPPVYIPTAQLYLRPYVIENLPPDVASLLSHQPPGTVILRLHISESGKVDDVIVEETDFPVDELQTIMKLFRSTVFSPGIKDGKAVKSELKIEVVVRPQLVDIPKKAPPPARMPLRQ